jgi:hypothetical protein
VAVQVPALSLSARVDRISQHIIRARLFLDLWFYFEEDISRRQIIETMREYNEFFRFAPHAYLMTYVVYMAGVFENRRDTINLVSLAREVQASGRLNAQDEATLSGLMSPAKPIAKKVAILRNNAFAHRTISMSYNDVFALASVTPGELQDITEIALKIANLLLSSCGLQDQHFTDLPRQDAASMMATLARAHGG